MSLKYLQLLSKTYRNIAETSTEIINLQAIMNLPKGTEYFITDVHGEYEAFNHVLRNGSGTVRRKIEEVFGDSLTENEKKELATLIYYPKERVEIMEEENNNIDRWMSLMMYRLIEVCKHVSSKYTRSKVRKSMTKDFEYILQELIYEQKSDKNKAEYFSSIIDSILYIQRGKEFIIAISNLIQRLNIDHLHIVGDIYDRGPSPHLIMDLLEKHHNVDIQWGNHDILWMGAAIGNKACICNVIRICSRYSNNDILEEAYGINLLPLATYAIKYYSNDNCKKFRPKEGLDSDLVAQIHKAITILQFKVEGIYAKRNPEYELEDRDFLSKINYDNYTVEINGEIFELNDKNFPTVDPNDPLKLTDEEAELLDKLKASFMSSEKLQRHINILFTKGSLYLKYNSNLLYHACIPIEDDLSFTKMKIDNEIVSGKKYLDKIDQVVRNAHFNRVENEKNKKKLDFLWYLWCGKNSPLFGKDAMKTFERYFIDDKKTHKEKKNPYYKQLDNNDFCDKILKEFELNPNISHIINGHVPVKVKDGESPIRCNGKLLIIDGGFSRAYQDTTGIAGYTLTYNSHGIKLSSHKTFTSREDAIKNGTDIVSSHIVVTRKEKRLRVKDTDIGKNIQEQINELKKLLNAYRNGIIKESHI